MLANIDMSLTKKTAPPSSDPANPSKKPFQRRDKYKKSF